MCRCMLEGTYHNSPRIDKPRAYRLSIQDNHTPTQYPYVQTQTSSKHHPIPLPFPSLPSTTYSPNLKYIHEPSLPPLSLSPSPIPSTEISISGPQRLQRRTQAKDLLTLRPPLLPCLHPIIPLPKNSPQIPRRTTKHDGAGGHKRSVLERGGQDAVFLREEEGRLELGGFGARVVADDAAITTNGQQWGYVLRTLQ